VATRSARLRSALARAPATKPSWTLMVSHACSAPSMPHSTESWGTTAEAENQRPMAKASARASSATWRPLSPRHVRRPSSGGCLVLKIGGCNRSRMRPVPGPGS